MLGRSEFTLIASRMANELIDAAFEGDTERGVTIQSAGEYGSKALHVAAANGDTECLKVILAACVAGCLWMFTCDLVVPCVFVSVAVAGKGLCGLW